jgi:N utilization substance protein A
VRLAAKLVGWRIDIKSEEEKRQEVEAEMARMARMVDELRSLQGHGISDKIVQKLIDAGVAGLAHLLEMSDEDLEGIEGVGPLIAEIREAAAEAKVGWDERDAEDAARYAAHQAVAEAEAEAEALEPETADTETSDTETGEAEAEVAAAEEPVAVVEGSEEPAAVVEGSKEPGQGGQPDGER